MNITSTGLLIAAQRLARRWGAANAPSPMFLNDPKKIKYTPVLSRIGFVCASASQVKQMFAEHTSAGQSILGWCIVVSVLIAWFNFYRVCVPEQKIARYVSIFAVIEAACVLAAVIYFRVR